MSFPFPSFRMVKAQPKTFENFQNTFLNNLKENSQSQTSFRQTTKRHIDEIQIPPKILSFASGNILPTPEIKETYELSSSNYQPNFFKEQPLEIENNEDKEENHKKNEVSFKENHNLLETYLQKENNTVIPFVKRFINKLKLASGFRDITQMKPNSQGLINDKAYFYENTDNNCNNKTFGTIHGNQKAFFAKIKEICLKYVPAFHPYQNLKIFWDMVHLTFIVFWLFFIPLTIVFDDFKDNEIKMSFYSLVFFITDFIVNSNTSYFKNGVIVRKRKNIFKNYFKNHFFLDFLGFFPIFLSFSQLIHLSPSTKFLKLLFMFKLFTLRKIIHRILEKFLLKERIQYILALFKVLFISLLVLHIFACFWCYTALHESSKSWLLLTKLTDSSWEVQYLYSLYWACVTMMTVGYGDITPQNDKEVLLCSVSILLGCAAYAYNLNSIGMILQDLNKENAEFEHKINIINQFMSRKNISHDLQRRVREYLRFIWKEENTQNLKEEQKIISLLSNSLKEELLIEAYGNILMRTPMFYANFTENSLKKVVNIIKDVKFFPEENILSENEDEDNICVYFIMKGKVQLMTQSGIVLKTMGKGEYFDEQSFFSGRSSGLFAKSKDFTTLYCINRKEFMNIIGKNSDDFEKFCMIKDQILLYGNNFAIKSRCFACNQMGHTPFQCNFIHFIPDKEKIIKTHNFYFDQEREPIYMRRTFSVNCLKIKGLAASGSKKLRDQLKKERESLEDSIGSIEAASDNDNDDDSEEDEDEENVYFQKESIPAEKEKNEESLIINTKEIPTIKEIFVKTNTFETQNLQNKSIRSFEEIIKPASKTNLPSLKSMRQCSSNNEISFMASDDPLVKNENFNFNFKEKKKNVNFKPIINKNINNNANNNINLSDANEHNTNIINGNDNNEDGCSPNHNTANTHNNHNINVSSGTNFSMALHLKKISNTNVNNNNNNSNNNHNNNSNPANNHMGSVSNVNVNNVMDGFDKVKFFKNYFPQSNSQVIFQNLNNLHAKISSKLLKNNKKHQRISKYTFFVEELKKAIALSKMKKKSIVRKSNHRKRMEFSSNILRMASIITKKKKITSSKSFIPTEIKFSDLVSLVMKNPAIKKTMKSKTKKGKH